MTELYDLNTTLQPQKVSLPKPGSWVKPQPKDISEASSLEKKIVANGSQGSEVKKPFVLKEHLTDRPFKDALQELRDSMPQPKRKPARRK